MIPSALSAFFRKHPTLQRQAQSPEGPHYSDIQGRSAAALSGGGHRGPAPGGRGNKGRNNQHQRPGRGRRDGGRGGRNGRQHNQPLMNIVIAPLEVTENRYIVKKDVEAEEKFLRQIKRILNKLTPEKFDVMLKQVSAVSSSRSLIFCFF